MTGFKNGDLAWIMKTGNQVPVIIIETNNVDMRDLLKSLNVEEYWDYINGTSKETNSFILPKHCVVIYEYYEIDMPFALIKAEHLESW